MARNRDKKAGKGSAGQNRKSSEIYIEKYAQKAEVQHTGSGLMYRILELGQAPDKTVGEFDRVTIHQRILLVDGTVIADTYREGVSDSFTVEQAIDGLAEGLQLMSKGARFEFVVPPELAWGKKGKR